MSIEDQLSEALFERDQLQRTIDRWIVEEKATQANQRKIREMIEHECDKVRSLCSDYERELAEWREVYVDESGNGWMRPTGEAYAATCAALHKKEAHCRELAKALCDLGAVLVMIAPECPALGPATDLLAAHPEWLQ